MAGNEPPHKQQDKTASRRKEGKIMKPARSRVLCRSDVHNGDGKKRAISQLSLNFPYMPNTNSDLEKAYAECERIARSHYENFPVGSLLIPKRIRPHFYALYAFMRTADDFADLPHRSIDERLQELSNWRQNLRSSLGHEAATSPIFLALQDTVQTFDLDPSLLHKLLDAFEFDARGNVHFDKFEDLHWYTSHSAEPVGQLVLTLFNYRDTKHIEASNNICTALQLINFLQDSKEDLENGRCYFPIEDLQTFDIESPIDISASDRARELVAYECDRIGELLAKGKILQSLLRGRLRLEIKAVLAGADMILGKIRQAGSGIFYERPTLSGIEQKMLIAKALLPF
jgi:squalene synthase HpnC